MPDGSTLALFAAAALALLLVPGPAVLYVVSQSVHHGRRTGLVSTLGLHAGTLVHVAAAAVGLSSLLATSATAFSAVKLAGAAYLVLLGVRRLLGRGGAQGEARTRPRSAFVQGAVVNVLNPKTALFFVAFLPQFVDPDAGSAPLQILVLGLTFVVLGLCTDSIYALTVGTVGGALRRSARARTSERAVSGSVLVGLGVVTAVSGSRSA